MNKIHLLIPCTARKTLDVPVSMNISEHSFDTLQETLENWEQAFSQAQKKVKAKDLYSGQTFAKLRLKSKELNLSLKILSAGFGLIDGETELPGYNATFAPNKNRVPTPNNSWWHAVNQSKLPSLSLKETFKGSQDDYFLVVASSEYLQAIQADLVETFSEFKNAPKRFAIIATSIPKSLTSYSTCFVKCSRQVLDHKSAKNYGLSIADRSITAIAALMFLNKIELTKPDFSDTISALNLDFAQLTPKQKQSRTKRDDDFIVDFIKNEILTGEHKPVSGAAALKIYQASGNACTDKRFATIYKQVKSEKGLS
ncbi:DUF6884 domain-containing protein [Vibrio lentus]